MDALDAAVDELGREIARVVAGRDELLEAAREVVNEYRSHGGKGTHQKCCEGSQCFVGRMVDGLAKSIAKAEGRS
jgi:hypothetical protein